MSNIILPDRYFAGFFEGNLAWNSGKPTTKDRIVSDYEFEYITQNGNFTYINDKAYSVIKDHIFFTAPGYKRHTDLPFVSLYIKFDAEGYIKEQCDQFPMCMPIVHTTEIEELFKKVIISNEKDSICVTAAHFLKLFNKLIKEMKLFDNNTVHNTNPEILTIISNTKTFISENYHEHIDLNDIANSVNLCESYLH